MSESKLKLTRGKVTIKFRNGNTNEVAAWIMNDLIACHKDLDNWAITHIATGYKITRFNGKYKDLRPLLADIKDLIDWSVSCPHKLTSLLFNHKQGEESAASKIRLAMSRYEHS